MAQFREPQVDPTDIKLLRVFMKVVECGGFAGAQAELNISAPTLSTQMATLESRLGMRLCDRGRIGFRLTDKGKRVYSAAQRLETALNEYRADVGALRGRLVGEMHLGIVDSTVTNPDMRTSAALGAFCRRDHAVHVTMHVAEPAVIEKRLLDGSLHVGISAFYHHAPGLVYRPLFEETHSLYYGRDHPLFEKRPDEVSEEEVRRHPYVARGYLINRTTGATAGMNAAATAFDMEATLTMLRSGAFIAHLPDHYARPWIEQGELRPVMHEIFTFSSRFEFAIRRGTSDVRVVNAFIKDLCAAHGVDAAFEE